MAKIYALYDNKVDGYNQPMFFENEHMAKESLTQFVNNQDEMRDINLADFELFYLGEYHNNTGKFDVLDIPKHLFNLRTLIKKGDN